MSILGAALVSPLLIFSGSGSLPFVIEVNASNISSDIIGGFSSSLSSLPESLSAQWFNNLPYLLGFSIFHTAIDAFVYSVPVVILCFFYFLRSSHRFLRYSIHVFSDFSLLPYKISLFSCVIPPWVRFADLGLWFCAQCFKCYLMNFGFLKWFLLYRY